MIKFLSISLNFSFNINFSYYLDFIKVSNNVKISLIIIKSLAYLWFSKKILFFEKKNNIVVRLEIIFI